jgi:hypothetical protein
MMKHDPENYRKMSEPFNGLDEANNAISAFFEEIGESRKRHRIPDVVVALSVNVRYEEGGREGAPITYATYGDAHKTESLLAYALGSEANERRERIAKLLKGKNE